jgi:hypothetical protein
LPLKTKIILDYSVMLLKAEKEGRRAEVEMEIREVQA